MNTYVLNGIMSDVPLKPDAKILECDFASSPLRRGPRARLSAFHRGVTLADPRKFAEQVQWCDALLLHGGDTPTLVERLNWCQGWRDHLHGKVIYAWSAGISALMTYSYNVDHYRIIPGLGILPYKSIVHYNSNRAWMLAALSDYMPQEKLTTVTIRDDEYFVFDM